MNTPPLPGSGRPSGVPYPPSTPLHRDDLPDRGHPGAPAAWGLRAAARILDLVIVLLPMNLIALLVGDRTDSGVQAPLWVRLIFPITFIVYETVLISRNGRTIGKLLFRTAAVEWTTGELPTPREAFIRALVPGIWYFAYLLGGPFSLLFFLPPIIYLTSVADTLYRGFHDKLANTIVLAVPKAPTAPER